MLFAALLIPLIAVGVLGLRALAGDVERARTRYLEQATTFARNVNAALEAVAGELETDPDALRFMAETSGALLEPVAPPPSRASALERSLREAVTSELDALERAGESERARARLAELATHTERPALAAWALTWSAARAQREGRLEDARAAWQQLIESFPDERDERGLVRALAARAELAVLDSSSFVELERLHADVVASRASLADSATPALASRVAERIAASAPERGPALRGAVVAQARELRLLASWSLGLSDWIARGAPEGVASVPWAADPALADSGPSQALVRATLAEGRWRGTALELERVAERALIRAERDNWRALGFDAAIEERSGRLLAGAAPPADAPATTERASGVLGELTVRAFGTTFEDFAAAERRRFVLVAVLTAVALAAALVAASATLRAVQRESQTARERESFVAAVTHELKSPLASIRLLAELLERGDVDAARVREFGARTVAESDRLAKLVDSVLRFSRLEGGLNAESLERLDARELATRAIESVAPLAQARGFRVELVDGPSPKLRGDRDALIGALAELVDNATKYGDAAAGVQLEIALDGPRVVLSVLDRGRGVPAESREQVFEPFRRLGDELTREQPGVGLGLALVRRVARAHAGRAACAEREGGGARFWIELPGEQG